MIILKEFTWKPERQSKNGSQPALLRNSRFVNPVTFVQGSRPRVSRITGKSETILGQTAVFTYSYDVAGRLTQVSRNGQVASTYTYDGNGNRVSGQVWGQAFTATYDDQDRLLTWNNRVYNHNANGDLTGVSFNTASNASFQYNGLSQLTNVTTARGQVKSYVYDLGGDLLESRLNGVTDKRFLYESPNRVVAEISDTGTIIKEFVHAFGSTTPAYMIYSGNRYRIITDHLGSPRLVVKSTDGTVAQRIDYNENGRVLRDTNSCFQPYGFAGGIYDRETGWVKFGARQYDPETGRWTSQVRSINDSQAQSFGFVIDQDRLVAFHGSMKLNVLLLLFLMALTRPATAGCGNNGLFDLVGWNPKNQEILVRALTLVSDGPEDVATEGNVNAATLVAAKIEFPFRFREVAKFDFTEKAFGKSLIEKTEKKIQELRRAGFEAVRQQVVKPLGPDRLRAQTTKDCGGNTNCADREFQDPIGQWRVLCCPKSCYHRQVK